MYESFGLTNIVLEFRISNPASSAEPVTVAIITISPTFLGLYFMYR